MRRFLVVLSIVVLAIPAMGQVQPPFDGGGGNGCQDCVGDNVNMQTSCEQAQGQCCNTTWYGCSPGPDVCQCMPVGNGWMQCDCSPTCGERCLWA